MADMTALYTEYTINTSSSPSLTIPMCRQQSMYNIPINKPIIQTNRTAVMYYTCPSPSCISKGSIKYQRGCSRSYAKPNHPSREPNSEGHRAPHSSPMTPLPGKTPSND